MTSPLVSDETLDVLKKLGRKGYRREQWAEPHGTIDMLCDKEDDGAEEYSVNPDGPQAIALVQTLSQRVVELEADVARKTEALREIADYKWPVIRGFHEHSTFGAATGHEYKIKIPIPTEQPTGAMKSMQGIARAALSKGQDQ